MEQHLAKAQPKDMRDLAVELLRQGERCAIAGLLQQAEVLLVQVWTIAEEHASDLASSAAWEVAWLLVRRGRYAESAEWFRRVAVLPSRLSQLWPAARQALLQLCLDAAQRSAATPSSMLPLVSPVAPPTGQFTALPRLKITNLGRFQVVRDGAELPICRARKSIALFRYLLTRRNRVAHKEELMDVFWPDVAVRQAGNSLHVAVNTLRRYLDLDQASYLLFNEEHYIISPNAPIEEDSASFRQLCALAEQHRQSGDLLRSQQAYADAIACYQGDYYVDNHALTWAIAEREQLLAHYLVALDHLGQIFVTQQHYEQAIECYQRLLERDNYREDAHYQLMFCYWQLGRRSEALRQYQRCALMLEHDLGLEPLQEIRRLYQMIVASSSPHLV